MNQEKTCGCSAVRMRDGSSIEGEKTTFSIQCNGSTMHCIIALCFRTSSTTGGIGRVNYFSVDNAFHLTFLVGCLSWVISKAEYVLHKEPCVRGFQCA